MALAFSICRLSAWRGQPANAFPSGVMTSQTSRATFPFGCDHGKMRNVSRSGTRPMSDSSIRVNPSIEDPSNWISPSSAFSNCERGTSTFLMIPRMSVNCRRRKRTFSLSQTFRISAAFMAAMPHPFFIGFGSRRGENLFGAPKSQSKMGTLHTIMCKKRMSGPTSPIFSETPPSPRPAAGRAGLPAEKLGPRLRTCQPRACRPGGESP